MNEEMIEDKYKKLIQDNKEEYEKFNHVFTSLSNEITSSLIRHGADNRRMCFSAFGQALVNYIGFLTKDEKTLDGAMKLFKDFNNMVTTVYTDSYNNKNRKK